MKNTKIKTPLEQMQHNAAKAEALLKQLANASRLMVMCHLVSGEKTVGEMAESIELSQSALSQHLARMKEVGLVKSEKRGLKVYYRINSIEAQAILSVLHLIYCKSN